jgi:branched-chain amino acid transport system permease protein
MFWQQLANGIGLGSIYALVAIGFTMVYGILFFINLPHGDVLMVGTYFVLGLIIIGVPFIVSIIIAAIATAILGVVIEITCYRRLRRVRRLAPLLSAIGVSYILSNGLLITAGPRPKSFPQPLSGNITIGNVLIPNVIVLTVVLTAILSIALELFVYRTRLGTAIRAASQDLPTTVLMGINVNLLISLSFAISGVFACIGGTMLAWRYGSVSPSIGFSIMLKAFAACVLGGIGNIRGAIVGGLILGLVEVFAVGYISSALRDIISFAVLVIVLLIRPSGLLGGRTEVAV